jgi:predicted dehydrogenase
MHYLAATLHILGDTLTDKAKAALATRPRRNANPGEAHVSDRGAVTMEMVIWAVAIIGIVGIVVAAITNYVTSKAGSIR